jgi:hypothetical protein
MKKLVKILMIISCFTSFANSNEFKFRVYGKKSTVQKYFESNPQQQQRQQYYQIDNLFFHTTNTKGLENPSVQALFCHQGRGSTLVYTNSLKSHKHHIKISKSQCLNLVRCIRTLGDKNEIYYSEIIISKEDKTVIDIDYSVKCGLISNDPWE